MYSLPSTSTALPPQGSDSSDNFMSDSSVEEVDLRESPKLAEFDLSTAESWSPRKRREYLLDMKETLQLTASREMPEASDDFSQFQLGRMVEAKKISRQIAQLDRQEDQSFVATFKIPILPSSSDGDSSQPQSKIYKVETFVNADGSRSFLVKYDQNEKLWEKLASKDTPEEMPTELKRLLGLESESGIDTQKSEPVTDYEKTEVVDKGLEKGAEADPELLRDSEMYEKRENLVGSSSSRPSGASFKTEEHLSSEKPKSDEQCNSSKLRKTLDDLMKDRKTVTTDRNLLDMSDSDIVSLSDHEEKSGEVFSKHLQPEIYLARPIVSKDLAELVEKSEKFVKKLDNHHDQSTVGHSRVCSEQTELSDICEHETPDEIVDVPINSPDQDSRLEGIFSTSEPETALENVTRTARQNQLTDLTGESEAVCSRTEHLSPHTGHEVKSDEDAGISEESSDDFEDVSDRDSVHDIAPEEPGSDSHNHRQEIDWNADFDVELDQLERHNRQLDKEGRSVTQEAYTDCQSLLRLFGIPFLVASGEAEAQCAYLEQSGLTHGTLTDDSDTLLFGSKTLVRHFFDRRYPCVLYRAVDIERNFGLKRRDLCRIAMLSGCDYTAGVSGIGVVKAVEILGELTDRDVDETVEPLIKYRKMCEERSRRTGIPLAPPDAFPASWPDSNIFNYFLHPDMDPSTSPFRWGQPDVDALERWALERMGWNKVKVDEVVGPGIKRWNERQSQQSMNRFLHKMEVDTAQLPKNSARVKAAIEKLTGSSPQKQEEPHPKRDRRKGANACARSDVDLGDGDVDSDTAPGPSSVRVKPATTKTTRSLISKKSIPSPDQEPSSSRSTGDAIPTSVDGADNDLPSTAGTRTRKRKREGKPPGTPRERISAMFSKSIAPGARARLKKMSKMRTGPKTQDRVDLSEESE